MSGALSVSVALDIRTPALRDDQLLQTVDRADNRRVDLRLSVTDAGLVNHSEVVEQLAGDITSGAEVTTPQTAERMELRGLPPTVIDFIEGLTVVGAHSQSPSFARAVTRYVAGAVLSPLRQLQRRAWTRRAVSPARPSGTTEASA